jgi:hypothetical protein
LFGSFVDDYLAARGTSVDNEYLLAFLIDNMHVALDWSNFMDFATCLSKIKKLKNWAAGLSFGTSMDRGSLPNFGARLPSPGLDLNLVEFLAPSMTRLFGLLHHFTFISLSILRLFISIVTLLI